MISRAVTGSSSLLLYAICHTQPAIRSYPILAACARAAWGTDGEPRPRSAACARLALFKHSLVGSWLVLPRGSTSEGRKTTMGEVDTAPEVAAKVIEDLTALEVDPDKCERLYKAALVQSNSGVTYRMLAK